ncbi:VRR-NUC domain-containing protein [Marinobacter salicampi]|uniref:VRR-NUC domain-containing protein n=1 Tax=Marinobacter salicampi TaxID=435907 RepID=UPI001407367F|nr:VRR-NUC domain-containing protein [Marinobacter salicampi]
MPSLKKTAADSVIEEAASWRPAAAPLEDPLYYLENFRTVIRWVCTHHGDLLLPEEALRLQAFTELPRPAQGLLVRLIMRSGDLFRSDKLVYPELGAGISDMLEYLVAGCWLDPRPCLELADMQRLFTKAEWWQAFGPFFQDLGLARSAAKKQLYQALDGAGRPPAPLQSWWPGAPGTVVALNSSELMRRVQLMFFGNLRQDWSEFVLSELGYQNYEPVAFTTESRAFGSRHQVDLYLHLQACRDRLDAGETPASVWTDVLPKIADNPWLESRRGRLVFELAKLAERSGDRRLALAAYADSGHREARLRQLRLLERWGRYDEAYALTAHAQAEPRCGSESLGLTRLRSRLARKVGAPVPPSAAAIELPLLSLELPVPVNGSVERAVLEHLSEENAPVFYVENTLLNGLFALLCWPALYAPLPGAFFHPFHGAPADLYREDFVARRRALFEECLAAFDNQTYRDRILANWQAKHGISSPFLAWPVLTRGVVEMALDCLPADHLKAYFQRMLEDLKLHRSGLPDLIRFWPRQRQYQLIEVKGPGDRLQDHQRQWLEFALEQGASVAVCHVRWRAGTT